MKSVKSLLAVLLSVLMLALCAGCGDSEPELKEKAINAGESTVKIQVPCELKQEPATKKDDTIKNSFIQSGEYNDELAVLVLGLTVKENAVLMSNAEFIKECSKEQANNLKNAQISAASDITIGKTSAKTTKVTGKTEGMDVELEIITFIKGHDLWGIIVMHKVDSESAKKTAAKIVKSIAIE